ncbi:MAG TPA: hypothetical protein ENJ84_07650, partial [Gammaproteobacteria bacterium]|nr:hypothetical protein [Gammaproteobacteria bacterium]
MKPIESIKMNLARKNSPIQESGYTFGYLRYKGKNTLNFREKSELHNREKDQFNIFMSREYYMAGSFETGIYLQIQDN